MNYEEPASLTAASARVSNSKRKLLVFVAFALPTLVLLVYGWYFIHLTFLGLPGPTDEANAFRQLGQFLLKNKIGEKNKFNVAGYTIQSRKSCSFLKFEAIRTHCRGFALVVPNYEESEKYQIIELTNFLALALSKPCENLDAMAPDMRKSVSHALGCTKREFRYRVIVQAISSKSIHMPTGGSYFENQLIYEQSNPGEI